MLVTYRFYIIFMLQVIGLLGRDTQAPGSRHRKGQTWRLMKTDILFDEGEKAKGRIALLLLASYIVL